MEPELSNRMSAAGSGRWNPSCRLALQKLFDTVDTAGYFTCSWNLCSIKRSSALPLPQSVHAPPTQGLYALLLKGLCITAFCITWAFPKSAEVCNTFPPPHSSLLLLPPVQGIWISLEMGDSFPLIIQLCSHWNKLQCFCWLRWDQSPQSSRASMAMVLMGHLIIWAAISLWFSGFLSIQESDSVKTPQKPI